MRLGGYLIYSGKRLREQQLITSGRRGAQGHVKHALSTRVRN